MPLPVSMVYVPSSKVYRVRTILGCFVRTLTFAKGGTDVQDVFIDDGNVAPRLHGGDFAVVESAFFTIFAF